MLHKTALFALIILIIIFFKATQALLLSVHMSPGAPHTQWLWQSFKKRVLYCPPQDDTLNTSRVLVLPNKPLETVSQRVVTEEKAPPTEVSIVRQSDGAPTCLKTENFTGWHGGVSFPCQLSCFAGAQCRTDSSFLFHWLDCNKLQSYLLLYM